MIALDVIVANPIVVLVHVMALALTQPDLIPIAVFLLLTNLVVAQESRGLGELTLGAV
jgi:hypothetical protein